MLIVEGPDMVGKTTLCHCLRRAINANLDGLVPRSYIYSHFSRKPAEWDYYWDYLPHMHRNVVQDRFHMSEAAYGPVTRGSTTLDELRYRLLDSQLALRGAFTVLITASDEWLQRQWTATPRDEMFTLDQVRKVNERYNLLASGNGPHPVHVDIHYHMAGDKPLFPSANEELVAQTLQRYIERQRQLRNLIGERRGPCYDAHA